MNQNIPKIIGLLLVVAGLAVGGWFYMQREQVPMVTLNAVVGGEKMGFLNNEKVQARLRKEHRIIVKARKEGSVSMVQQIDRESDFIWPSSKIPLEIYQAHPNNNLITDQVAFSTPIALCSWDIVVDKLQEAGIVEKTEQQYYVVDFDQLLQAILEGREWKEFGIPLYGKMRIATTDPTASNSGMMVAALIATVLNGGEQLDPFSAITHLMTMKELFAKLGHMETSSSDLFESYLSTGVGSKPIIGCYESQMIEFAKLNPEIWSRVQNKFRIMYPIPTVWSEHVIMVLKPAGKRFLAAMQEDPELQRLAWESHGFRTGLVGVQISAKVLEGVQVPEQITQVVPTPGPEAMFEILNILKVKGNPFQQ